MLKLLTCGSFWRPSQPLKKCRQGKPHLALLGWVQVGLGNRVCVSVSLTLYLCLRQKLMQFWMVSLLEVSLGPDRAGGSPLSLKQPRFPGTAEKQRGENGGCKKLKTSPPLRTTRWPPSFLKIINFFHVSYLFVRSFVCSLSGPGQQSSSRHLRASSVLRGLVCSASEKKVDEVAELQ